MSTTAITDNYHYNRPNNGNGNTAQKAGRRESK